MKFFEPGKLYKIYPDEDEYGRFVYLSDGKKSDFRKITETVYVMVIEEFKPRKTAFYDENWFKVLWGKEIVYVSEWFLEPH